jgi:hypothetical protein
MSSLNTETPSLPFDPTRIRIEAPGQSDGRKRRFASGPCNYLDCGCLGFVGTENICQRDTCGHSWYDHN